MLEAAWNEYRGWARRARALQQSNRRWSLATLIVGLLAATFGCAAGQTAIASIEGRILSFLAAAAAALTLILGRDILDLKREAGWIQARAAAEAIKSECFRYSAKVSDYVRPNADDLLMSRCDNFSQGAIQRRLAPLNDPASEDTRRPPHPMTVQWYLEHRVREQRNFYSHRQTQQESAVARLRALGLSAAVAAALLGAAGTTFGASWLAPWIGVITTLGAMIVAYGLMERRLYLAASYAAMANRLSRIESRAWSSLGALVAETESLLGSEHAVWTERMTESIPAPPPLGEAAARPASDAH